MTCSRLGTRTLAVLSLTFALFAPSGTVLAVGGPCGLMRLNDQDYATVKIDKGDEIHHYAFRLGPPCARIDVTADYDVQQRAAVEQFVRQEPTGGNSYGDNAFSCDGDPWISLNDQTCDAIFEDVACTFTSDDFRLPTGFSGPVGPPCNDPQAPDQITLYYPASVLALSDSARSYLNGLIQDNPLRIRVTPVPTHASTQVDGWPHLDLDTQGEAVNTAQYLLKVWDPNYIPPLMTPGKGLYNDRTVQEVRAFQQAQALSVDGVIGSDTWQALLVTVQQGDMGPAVMAVQSQLRTRGVVGVPIDGQFTADLDARVRDFQNSHGLTVDGIVGPQTWQVLLSGT